VDVQAARKAGVLWVTVSGRRPVACWHLWRDDRSYVLTGPGEQPVPGLADAATCEVRTRAGDTWTARVAVVGGAERAEVFPALAAARRNGRPDPATAVVLSLTPEG
jgi:hypothetical protein